MGITEEEEKISLKVKRGGERASGAAHWGTFVAAGAAGGLLALNRPNALLCVAAVAAAFFLFLFKENLLRRVGIVAAFVGGTALAIAPFTLRNLLVSHEPVLISSHGGLNFLVGNGPGATGVYRAIPGITPDIGGQARDAKKVAEAAEGRELSTREVSSHFAREALHWIRTNPGAAFSLFLRKIRYSLSGDEAPLNFSYPWYRDHSLVLKLLCVGPGLLVPLAGAGFVLALFASAGASRRALLVWSTFVPAYVLAVAVFFVATRYRLPLLVALAPLAGAAVARLPEALRSRRGGLAPAAAVAAVLAAVSLWPTGLYDGAADEEMQLVLWEIEKGDAGAMAHAEAAASAHPTPPSSGFVSGARSSRRGSATRRSRRSRGRTGSTPPGRTRRPFLSSLLEKRGLARILAGDGAGARPDLEEAVRLDPPNASALLNLAVVLAEGGEKDRARSLARRALEVRPDYAKARAFLDALDRMK